MYPAAQVVTRANRLNFGQTFGLIADLVLCFQTRRPNVSCVKTQTISAQESSTAGEVVYVRWTVFDALCNERGWKNDHQRAKAMGFASHTTIRRLRKPKSDAAPPRPGGKFIGNTLAALGVEFEVVFGRRAA